MTTTFEEKKYNVSANDLFSICISAIDAIGKVEKANEKIGEIRGSKKKSSIMGRNYTLDISLTIMPLGKEEATLSCEIKTKNMLGINQLFCSDLERKGYDELLSKIHFIIDRENQIN